MRSALLMIALAVLPSRGLAQLSPGPLSRAHESLDSPLACVKCHGGRRESTTQRCLACHREIAWMRTQNRGYHARDGKGECASCHPDHAGRDFALIKWPTGSPRQFDHAAAGWALEGKHLDAACTSCHKLEFRVSAAAKVSPRDGGPRWVGLEQRCTSCHVDPHRSALGGDCASCHGVAAWKPAARFDHDSTAYPLKGAHEKVSCDGCHLAARLAPKKNAAGELIPVFKPVPAADCASCHRDPHRGRATLSGKVVDCAACHTVDGFKRSTFTVAAHQRTAFPLVGRHASVSCSGCHKTLAVGAGRAVAEIRPLSTRCADCHTDPHGAQLTAGRRTDRGACETCHNVAVGWQPSVYSREAHAKLRLPLEGRHAEIACGACHGPDRRGLPPLPRATLGTANVVIRPPEVTCAACHRNVHGDAVTGSSDCASCHGTRAFRPSIVDVAAHARLRFPLEGAHRAVACNECHRELAQPVRSRGIETLILARARDTTRVVFAAPRTCAGCHVTPHGRQFESRRDRGSCESCHTVASWQPASRFDHDRDTPFKLRPAHTRVACVSCHVRADPRDLKAPVLYRGAVARCSQCHAGGGR